MQPEPKGNVTDFFFFYVLLRNKEKVLSVIADVVASLINVRHVLLST